MKRRIDVFFLFDKGCFVPMNFFAGAATGGRPLGRAFFLQLYSILVTAGLTLCHKIW